MFEIRYPTKFVIEPFLFLLQIVFFVVSAVSAITCSTKLTNYEIYPDSLDIISGEVDAGTGTIHISTSDGTVSHLCHGPGIELKKGTYYVTIHYTASESGNLFFLI